MPAENGPAPAPRAASFSDVTEQGLCNGAINILAAGGKSRPFVKRFVTIAQ
jgi:hypothetical protein